MQAAVARDLENSATEFQRVVWPVISGWFGGGELVSIESVQNTGFMKLFDTYSGIDAWHISTGKQLRGVASRVQWIDDDQKPWDTFTVRTERDSGARTELAKRLEAIKEDHGYLYPHLTVQAYCSKPCGEGELLSVAAVRTDQLILRAGAIEKLWRQGGGITPFYPQGHNGAGVRRTSNATFVYMSFAYLRAAQFQIKTWPMRDLFDDAA